ncbi:hypothetical protein CEUSTIGMA_g11018.t1 [Chlamydomonas eustigma]|uniref:Uncharacterized protein n=1 Tax=Chlamydomonas eustigma TaxID=1157962 RepID=A0A250XKP3_9CHLO|nr:hypothetical protein CEUSTIGMA_g11018.t1 [Chlamydomonas eustigma]|eukprot:GAX83593.1 hypothetical protein CEUSTIGMA_g11018.t1 [Chlamydomonas eustigma]
MTRIEHSIISKFKDEVSFKLAQCCWIRYVCSTDPCQPVALLFLSAIILFGKGSKGQGEGPSQLRVDSIEVHKRRIAASASHTRTCTSTCLSTPSPSTPKIGATKTVVVMNENPLCSLHY